MATIAEAKRRKQFTDSFFGYSIPFVCPECSLDLAVPHPEYQFNKEGHPGLHDIWAHYDAKHPAAALPHLIFNTGWARASSEPNDSIPSLTCLCGETLTPSSPTDWYSRSADHLLKMEQAGESCLQPSNSAR